MIETQLRYPLLKTCDALIELMNEKDWRKFEDFWGHKDEKKYNTLKSILSVATLLRKAYPNACNDYELLNNWATNADLKKYNEDPIGGLPNVAIATFQHLRMVFGVDTVKPDQRVKEILEFEFLTQALNDINAILAVEEIAEICDLKVLEVDQIFVNYGSGYYNRVSNKLTQRIIAQKLKEKEVDEDIIGFATGLSRYQISTL